MNKIKQISKYATNILAIINALIVGLNPIWNIPYADKISETITVIIAVIGTYLLGSKVTTIYNREDIKTSFSEEEFEELCEKSDENE